MPNGIDYTTDEWAASVGHLPFGSCPGEELMLLHRHWMWANQQREAFEALLGKEDLGEPGPLMMATKSMGFMFVWYGMLWSVIEACVRDRKMDFRDAFGADIAQMSDTLRRCRNAVLHVPKDSQLLDERIEQLVMVLDSPATIRRIHRGFGRLFVDEFRRRTAENATHAALADSSLEG